MIAVKANVQSNEIRYQAFQFILSLLLQNNAFSFFDIQRINLHIYNVLDHKATNYTDY